jgi:hypothetical protein
MTCFKYIRVNIKMYHKKKHNSGDAEPTKPVSNAITALHPGNVDLLFRKNDFAVAAYV